MWSFIKFVIIVGLIYGFCEMYGCVREDDERLRDKVYQILEKDHLTREERDFVDFATDDREMKESTVFLDETHSKLYRYHFKRNR